MYIFVGEVITKKLLFFIVINKENYMNKYDDEY